MTTHRPDALEQAQFLLDDFRDAQRRQAETEARMVAVLRDPDPGADRRRRQISTLQPLKRERARAGADRNAR